MAATITNTDKLIGGALVAGIAIALIVRHNKKKQAALPEQTAPVAEPQPENPSLPASPSSQGGTLNRDLVLKRGSTGNEVRELQRLLGITADGIFGPQTEAKLKAVKFVTQVSLNKFATLPGKNPNPLKPGNRVMANVRPKIKVDGVKKLASGDYSHTGQLLEYVDFGDEVGKIIAVTPSGNYYVVEMPGFLTNKLGWVNAADVKKI